MNILPNELIYQTLDYLNTSDLLSVQSSCRHLRQLAADRLWANLEINCMVIPQTENISNNNNNNNSSNDDRWTKDFKRNKITKQPWMVLNENDIDIFWTAYSLGLLNLVLPSVRTVNIVQSVDQDDVRILNLNPIDLPRLQLLRMAANNSMNGCGLKMLDNFGSSSVEKHLWVNEYKLLKPTSRRCKSLTSLSISLTDESELTNNLGYMVRDLESLQLISRNKNRCVVITADFVQNLTRFAKKLQKLILTRVEINNEKHGVDWIPSQVKRIKILAQDTTRPLRIDEPHINDNNDTPVSIDNVGNNTVTSLYADLTKSKGSSVLTNIKFTNLSSVFIRSVYRPNLPVEQQYDVKLFESNPKLKRVVYNCSSYEGLNALARNCPQLEILSLSRPITRMHELILYDLDLLEILAKNCKQLRILSIGVQQRNICNAIAALKLFIQYCENTLEQIFFVSMGNFCCKGVSLYTQSFVNDGYCVQYLKTNRKNKLYTINIEAFKDAYL